MKSLLNFLYFKSRQCIPWILVDPEGSKTRNYYTLFRARKKKSRVRLIKINFKNDDTMNFKRNIRTRPTLRTRTSFITPRPFEFITRIIVRLVSIANVTRANQTALCIVTLHYYSIPSYAVFSSSHIYVVPVCIICISRIFFNVYVRVRMLRTCGSVLCIRI